MYDIHVTDRFVLDDPKAQHSRHRPVCIVKIITADVKIQLASRAVISGCDVTVCVAEVTLSSGSTHVEQLKHKHEVMTSRLTSVETVWGTKGILLCCARVKTVNTVFCLSNVMMEAIHASVFQ